MLYDKKLRHWCLTSHNLEQSAKFSKWLYVLRFSCIALRRYKEVLSTCVEEFTRRCITKCYWHAN